MYISTLTAARRMGFSARRINALIKEGRLPAQKIGGIWLINPADLDRLEIKPQGRPPKVANTCPE
jgi:excisionase family DNA binding protein